MYSITKVQPLRIRNTTNMVDRHYVRISEFRQFFGFVYKSFPHFIMVCVRWRIE